jgi:hypothetical protein
MRVQAQALRHRRLLEQHHLEVAAHLTSSKYPPQIRLYKHSICAFLPSPHSCAPSTPSQTRPAHYSDRVPRTPSGAPSTTPRSAQFFTDLCPTSPSWVRYSDHQAIWRTTQTTRYRRPRASGRRSSRQVRIHCTFIPAYPLTLSRAVPHSPKEGHRAARVRYFRQALPRCRRLHVRRLRGTSLQGKPQIRLGLRLARLLGRCAGRCWPAGRWRNGHDEDGDCVQQLRRTSRAYFQGRALWKPQGREALREQY